MPVKVEEEDTNKEAEKKLAKDAKKAQLGYQLISTHLITLSSDSATFLWQAISDASGKLKWAISLLPNLSNMCFAQRLLKNQIQAKTAQLRSERSIQILTQTQEWEVRRVDPTGLWREEGFTGGLFFFLGVRNETNIKGKNLMTQQLVKTMISGVTTWASLPKHSNTTVSMEVKRNALQKAIDEDKAVLRCRHNIYSTVF